MLDSTHIIVQNLSSSNSNFEIYAPYIAVLVSLIALFVNYYLTQKQIRENNGNIHKQIEASSYNLNRQLQANLDHMKADNIIKLRKEWIHNFSLVISKIYGELFSFSLATIRTSYDIKPNLIGVLENIKNLNRYRTELILLVTIEGHPNYDIYDFTIKLTEQFADFCRKEFVNDKEYKDELKKKENDLTNFVEMALNIVTQETMKLSQ